ncbi:MAG TPA: phosphodiester glycosidase family protein [Solirubrobacteraceae bacterium]|nr:phosphodiester glycosidase family protein [Solirubrobacteraceae bacterium]
MAALNLAVRAVAPPDGRSRRGRLLLEGGARTMFHVACYDAARTEIGVSILPAGQERLEPWCARQGVREALVGGFFRLADGLPLGEVRTHGVVRDHVAFAAPWHAVRACVHVQGGRARIARRHELHAEPRGDLLQAGPMLVAGGALAYDPRADTEGFHAASHQFDNDITDGRHPRAALGLSENRVVAVAVDGRSHRDAGLTLLELARLMIAMGCEDAINLDGGGSASLVSGGYLQNAPRRAFEEPEPGGRPISTALVLRHIR